MIDRLPYQLTDGVTATREGLVFDDSVERRSDGYSFWEETTGLLNALQQIGKLQAHKNGADCVVTWPAAAERLRYREGEPWCGEITGTGFQCYGPFVLNVSEISLHRLAAILCDDAEAFRVLHWCVNNLGGQG